jgi:hypothetical protein
MEELIIQHPSLILLIWTILNLLHYCLNLLSIRLYKNLPDFDSQFETNCDKKYFLKLLLWLGFGIGVLVALRQAMLEKGVTAYQYFAWVGAFFFLIMGYLLMDILSLTGHFVFWKRVHKIAYSFKDSAMVCSFEFFAYSTLILLSFVISKNPFLLGGTIGLAFGGILCIVNRK